LPAGNRLTPLVSCPRATRPPPPFAEEAAGGPLSRPWLSLVGVRLSSREFPRRSRLCPARDPLRRNPDISAWSPLRRKSGTVRGFFRTFDEDGTPLVPFNRESRGKLRLGCRLAALDHRKCGRAPPRPLLTAYTPHQGPSARPSASRPGDHPVVGRAIIPYRRATAVAWGTACVPVRPRLAAAPAPGGPGIVRGSRRSSSGRRRWPHRQPPHHRLS
jgi:hypothetical protein